MAGNLKARLERIRTQGGTKLKPQADSSLHHKALGADQSLPASFPPPWVTLDPLVLFRKERIPLECSTIRTEGLSEFLRILFRGSRNAGQGVRLEELLVFDLETTGLSGGAGTVAFLAAFGELVGASLEIRQYLLLDYPGEPVFIDHIEQELTRQPQKVLVSYNGKTCDIPRLRSRFILQGRLLPEKEHIDLLPLSRLLWKGLVPSCSQGNLEAFVLQKVRQGDIPGALAPQIWFSFVRKCGEGESLNNLLSVCHHNLLDIQGLVALFTLLLHIGSRPLEALETIPFNADRLALLWPQGTMRLTLLETTAGRGSARALFELARLARQGGDWDAYRRYLEQILETPYAAGSAGTTQSPGPQPPVYQLQPPVLSPQSVSPGLQLSVPSSAATELAAATLRLRASIGLASFYEWNKGDLERAEGYTRLALDLLEAAGAERRRAGARGLAPSINMKLEKRLKRILAKRQKSC